MHRRGAPLPPLTQSLNDQPSVPHALLGFGVDGRPLRKTYGNNSQQVWKYQSTSMEIPVNKCDDPGGDPTAPGTTLEAPPHPHSGLLPEWTTQSTPALKCSTPDSHLSAPTLLPPRNTKCGHRTCSAPAKPCTVTSKENVMREPCFCFVAAAAASAAAAFCCCSNWSRWPPRA